MLPETVATFIETNIDNINNNNWEDVFKHWYLLADDYYLADLFHALEQAGIDVQKDSFSARKHVLTEIAKCKFAVRKYNKRVTKRDMFNDLDSFLGFDEGQLELILDTAAKSQGFAKAINGWYIV